MRKHLTHYPLAWLAMSAFALAITVPPVLMMGGRLWMAVGIAAFATVIGAGISRATS